MYIKNMNLEKKIGAIYYHILNDSEINNSFSPLNNLSYILYMFDKLHCTIQQYVTSYITVVYCILNSHNTLQD